MELSFDLISYFIFFLTGIGAGFIDSTVGGGGLIALPVMMSMGIPAHNIFATNKLHAVFGTIFALHRFHKKGFVDFKSFFPKTFFLILICGAIGSLVIIKVPAEYLYKIIPVLMLLILTYKICFFNHGVDETNKHLINSTLVILIFAPLMGFYDGFFGPGAGMFWIFILIVFLGQNMLKASANTKLLNLASNIGSLIIFIPTGLILYKVGLAMALGQIFGSWAGVHLSVKKGAKFINGMFICMMTALVIKMFWEYYF